MKYFYLYIFLLLCFIFGVSYLNTYLNSTFKEPFHSGKQTFILLGDSILKNNAYVTHGKSVEELLQERTNGKTLCLAKDDSKILNIYSQVDDIPEQLNNNFTTIFLSAGGNDILSHFVEKENDVKNTNILETMFESYKKLIESIHTKIPNASIVLLDIYYPNSEKYKQYHLIIKEWNEKLYSFALEPKNNIVSVLKVSSVLTKSEDFSHGIEPSSNGSIKMVDSILSSY
jgi:lysophospholipase L1-like esterase